MVLNLELEKMSVRSHHKSRDKGTIFLRTLAERDIPILLLKAQKLRQTQPHLSSTPNLVDCNLQESTTNHPTKTSELFEDLAPLPFLSLLMNLVLSIRTTNRPTPPCFAFQKKQGVAALQSTTILQLNITHPKASLEALSAGFHSKKSLIKNLVQMFAILKNKSICLKYHIVNYRKPTSHFYSHCPPHQLTDKKIYFNTKSIQNYY